MTYYDRLKSLEERINKLEKMVKELSVRVEFIYSAYKNNDKYCIKICKEDIKELVAKYIADKILNK